MTFGNNLPITKINLGLNFVGYQNHNLKPPYESNLPYFLKLNIFADKLIAQTIAYGGENPGSNPGLRVKG